MKLRPYQQEVAQKTIQSKSSRIIIDLPMGGGKSLIISKLAEHYSKQSPVVVLTETSALIDQLDYHLKLYMEPPHIIKAGKHRQSGSNIYLIMEQSFHDDKRKEFEHLKKCIILRDEIHKGIEGKRFKEIINFLEPQKIIGLSGTPYDEKARTFKEWEYINGVSMQELINQGFLKKPKYFIPKIVKSIDTDKLSESGNDYNQREAGELLSQDKILNAVRTTCKQIDLNSRYTLFICSSIEQAEKTYEIVKDLTSGAVVHSKQKEDFNEKAINMFKKGDLRFLISVSKIAIGFDAPIANTLINLRPTKILRLWKQFGARHLRSNEKDEYGELYDFGKCIQNLGFVEDEYNPLEPQQTKEYQKYIDSYVNQSSDEVVPVTKESVEVFVEEIKRKEKENLSNLSTKDLVVLFDATQSIDKMMDIANEFNYRKYGWKYKTSTIDLAKKNMLDVYNQLELYGKGQATLKAYKTRIRNILNQGKKLASMIYFPDFLHNKFLEQHPWIIEDIQEAEDVF